MTPTLTFYGGAGTVTGSKYLIRSNGQEVLLDCGLFQGLKRLRLRNWNDPPFDPAKINAVVLSHAHLDHSGYLPRLVKNGFKGNIFCTSGTADLLPIMLLDSAHLQEEEAYIANKIGYSKHKPAFPLYTVEDAEQTLEYIKPWTYGKPLQVTDEITAIFRRAGHILGSATVEIQIGKNNPLKLIFSGDLGRWNLPILRDPEMVSEADILLIESTYGNRIHAGNSDKELARIINEAAHRKGVLVVPAFAIGRTQHLIWTIRQLEEKNEIPSIPVFLDSPMALNVTDLYCKHPEDHNLDMKLLMDEKRCPLCCKQFHIIRSSDESRSLNRIVGPAIIISASGMATGGRVLHHLKERLPDSRNTVLLAGYQAAGTRGRSLQDGADKIKMYGAWIPVRAKIEIIDGLSAHADQNEILKWLSGFKRPPKQVYVVHGEPQGAEALANMIHEKLGWNARVAVDAETVELGSWA